MNRIRLLAVGARPPGVYRWDTGVLPGTAAAALRRAGRPVAVLDGRFARDRASFLDELARALAFPAYFGRSWDAAADCLHDVEPGTVLIWDRADELAVLDRGAFDTAVEVLVGAAGDGLTTLLRGAPVGGRVLAPI